MGQILRPDGTTASTHISSGDHTSIDEATADDADYIYTQGISSDNPAAYECSLSDPVGVPASGPATARWRAFCKTGDSLHVKVSLMQGNTAIAGPVDVQASSIAVSNYEGEFDTAGVTDWSDVRLRFDFVTPSSCRAQLYWAELEIPDQLPTSGMLLMF